MRVLVLAQDGKTIPLQVEPSSSVASVKELLKPMCARTCLFLGSKPLEDGRTLAENGVTNDAVLHCYNDAEDLRLLMFLPKHNPLFQSVYARLQRVSQLSSEAQIVLLELFPKEGGEDLQDQLRKLPHLDEAKHNSREYATLEKVLYDLSHSVKPMDARLSQYFCEVLDRFVAASLPEIRLHVLVLMISAILRNAGLSLNPKQKPMYEQVRALLSGDLSVRPSVANEVLVALRATSVLLRDPSKEARLDARHICQVLQLPLELPLMLSLSIDGVKLDDEKKGNLVLVIGGSGSGKSTLVNSLTGTEYELCKSIGGSFLQPIEGQPVPPAKVGHDVTAQTLYPQVIRARDRMLSFCDCPGFHDNRGGAEAICASVGVPLAIRHASKISAIILTVSSRSLLENDRGVSFRLLSRTLAAIIKLPEQANLPFFFVMTRPPKNEPISDLRQNLIYNLRQLSVLATRQTNLLPDQEQRLAKLRMSAQQLEVDLDELIILRQGAVDRVRTLVDFLTSLLGGFVEANRIERKVSEMKAEWRAKGLSEISVKNLGDFLHRALESHRERRSVFLAEIDAQIDNWNRNKDNFNAQIKALEQEMENVRNEDAILQLVLKNTDNLFIIRGYADKQDPDDQERLYRALSRDSEIPKDLFLFDPDNQTFDAVKRWIEEFSGNFEPKLQQLIQLQDGIARRLTPAIEDARAFIRQTQEEISMEIKDSNDKIAIYLELKIDNRAKEYKDLEVQQIRLYQKRADYDAELQEIMTAPARDFRSELKLEKAPWAWLKMNWSWTFNFRRHSNLIAAVFAKFGESEIPIERVELSCVLNEENRVVFRTDIDEKAVEEIVKFGVSNPLVEIKALANKVFVVCDSGMGTRYGYFVIKENELEKGLFSTKYYSDDERKGRCGVRVFVLPRNMPEWKARIQELQTQIGANQAECASLASRSSSLERNIANDKEYLELLKAGNRNQSAKILRIVELLSRLGACQEEEVINLLGLNEAVLESFRWLRNPAYFELTQSILQFKGEGFPETILGIDLRTLLAIMGVNFNLRMAVVKDKEEADQRQNELKHGESMIYKVQKTGKIRILFYHNANKLEQVPVDRGHEAYNLLSALITHDEPNDQVFRVVYGILQPKVLHEKAILKLSEQKPKIKLDKLLQALPRQFFVHMQKAFQRTGFTVVSLHTILTGLKQQYELKDAAMQSCKKLERERALAEFFFTKLRSLYEASTLQLSTAEEIIALLNYGNHHAVSVFLRSLQEVKSRDLSQITYAVSGELEEFVEREVVDKAAFFQQVHKFSDAEWLNQVVSGDKARPSWTGRYPDKSRIEFESQKPEPELAATLGISLGDAAEKLKQADKFARAALVWELRAFMRRENRTPPDLAPECAQLKQNAHSFGARAKDLVAQFGLHHKFTSLEPWSACINKFPDTEEGSAREGMCLAFAHAIRVHFADAAQLEGRLLIASQSTDMFNHYRESIAEGKPVGPETLALVAKLSGKPLVIWEQLLSEPRMLHVKASSGIKGGKAVHLLFVPTERDTYQFATLFHHDELVGPDLAADDNDEVKREALDEESKQSPPASSSSADAVVGAESPSPASASPKAAPRKRPPLPPPFFHE